MTEPIHLRDYQNYAVDFALSKPSCGLFMDMGTGKTLIALSWLYRYAALGRLRGHVLVIGPKTIVQSTWPAEIEKWGFHLRTVSLVTNEKGRSISKKKRLERIEAIPDEPTSLYLINESPAVMAQLIERYQDDWPFSVIIIDESQGFSNWSSQRLKLLKTIRSKTDYTMLMSGTPASESLLQLFSQIWLIDQGYHFGDDFEAFKNTFFKPSDYAKIGGVSRVISWEPKPGAEDEIYRRVSRVAISVKNPDLNLPEIIHNTVEIHLSDHELKAYQQFRKDMVLDMIDTNGEIYTIKASNAAVLTNKLLQFASGTLYTDDKHHYKIVHRRKIQRLIEMIETIDTPVIIAYRFRAEKEVILDALGKAGYDAQNFDGSRQMVDSWNQKQIPIMLLQPASAAHGLNLQYGGHHLIWFTLPDSSQQYQQANKRLHRPGQENTVIIHEMMTQQTRDAHQLSRLNSKANREQKLLDAVQADITEVLGDVDLNIIDDIPEGEQDSDPEDHTEAVG